MLAPVKTSKWAAPIVPVTKKDGRTRIPSSNTGAVVPRWPMLAAAGGDKLDGRTSKSSLMRPPPFGVSSAPATFPECEEMENFLGCNIRAVLGKNQVETAQVEYVGHLISKGGGCHSACHRMSRRNGTTRCIHWLQQASAELSSSFRAVQLCPPRRGACRKQNKTTANSTQRLQCLVRISSTSTCGAYLVKHTLTTSHCWAPTGLFPCKLCLEW